MARRSYGEGSVYPVPSGSGWMADVSVMLPSGKRKRVRRRAKNKTEAKRLLREIRDELSPSGEMPNRRRTVAAAVANYLAVREGSGLQPRTLDKDRRHAKIITAGIGGRRLEALTVDDCDRFLQAAAEGSFGAPIGRPELRRLRQKLVRVIENEERSGLVARNVATLSVVPDESPNRIPRREPRAIPLAEIDRLISVSDGAIAVFIDLVGRNGLRPAEARGLRWSRVDLNASTVRVDAQMNRDNDLAKAKTKRSYRTIRVDAETHARLFAWQSTQSELAAAAGPAWSGNSNALLMTTALGTPINQRNVHRSLVLACHRAGIEPQVAAYDLRHSAITLTVENGHPLHKIADWAGTSERMIADVYRHKLDIISDLGAIG